MSGKMKGTWGGKRKGAGRPPGTGSGPSYESRNFRVMLMLTRAELEQLRALAAQRAIAVGTMAYEIVRAALARRRKQLPATKKEKRHE